MVRATLLLPGCPPERALAAFTDPATLYFLARLGQLLAPAPSQ
jgi:hypothetical protein